MPEGMVVVPSKYNAEETLARLGRAIAASGNRIFAEIDHAEAAKDVGLKLPPTTVVIFGNPEVGTHLMQDAQTIAIDLPLKMLVWQDAAGKTWLGYNDPHWLAKRHGGTQATRSTLDAITRVLKRIGDETARVAPQPVPPLSAASSPRI